MRLIVSRYPEASTWRYPRPKPPPPCRGAVPLVIEDVRSGIVENAYTIEFPTLFDLADFVRRQGPIVLERTRYDAMPLELRMWAEELDDG